MDVTNKMKTSKENKHCYANNWYRGHMVSWGYCRYSNPTVQTETHQLSLYIYIMWGGGKERNIHH